MKNDNLNKHTPTQNEEEISLQKVEKMISNPQRRQIDNRRSEMAKWRSHKRWKNLVEEHAHVPGAVCAHCLKHHGDIRVDRNGKTKLDKRKNIVRVNLTINHLSRTSYFTEETHSTWDEANMEICCTLCNWKIESGLKPCPVCHYAYIHWRDTTCQACWDIAHPIEAQKRMAKVQERLTAIKELKARIKADKKAEKERFKIDHPKVKRSYLRPNIHDEKCCKLD